MFLEGFCCVGLDEFNMGSWGINAQEVWWIREKVWKQPRLFAPIQNWLLVITAAVVSAIAAAVQTSEGQVLTVTAVAKAAAVANESGYSTN